MAAGQHAPGLKMCKQYILQLAFLFTILANKQADSTTINMQWILSNSYNTSMSFVSDL